MCLEIAKSKIIKTSKKKGYFLKCAILYLCKLQTFKRFKTDKIFVTGGWGSVFWSVLLSWLSMRNKLLYASPDWTALFFSFIVSRKLWFLLWAHSPCRPFAVAVLPPQPCVTLLQLSISFVPTDFHLSDHSFISGRETKTSSSVSRSSSAFESSHLSPPEDTTQPRSLNSTSMSKIYVPCVTSSQRFSRTISTSVGPENLLVSGKVFGRSQSCTELREPASEPLRRSFSVTFFHKKQKKQPVKPKNWRCHNWVKTEESTPDTAGPQEASELISPACSTLNGATAHTQEPAETTQNTHLLPAPAVQMQRPRHLLPVPSSPTTPICLYKYNDNMPSPGMGSPSLSATIEAQRLKRQRKRVNRTLYKWQFFDYAKTWAVWS